MKRILFIEAITAFAIGIIAGITLSLFRPTEPRIVRKTETVNRYVQSMPTDYAGMVAAWNSPLAIEGTMSGAWLNVTATDGYKEARKGFEIAGAPTPRNVIIGGIGVQTCGMVPTYAGHLGYYRLLWGRLGAGGVSTASPVGLGVYGSLLYMF